MKGEIILFDQVEEDNYEFELNPSDYDFSLCIYVDEENTFSKQIRNKEKFIKCIKYMRTVGDKEVYYYDGEKKLIKYLEKNLDNILNDTQFIRLSFEKQNNKEYIMNNPFLLTKKIVLSELLEITDYDRVIYLMKEYEDIIDKVYVSLIGNNNYVSLKDCYKTINAIKEQADKIKDLNLSQMETIMYVYDHVRNRVYTEENEDEELYKSRDLTQVMFGDKIVCSGYASLFHALLTYLGIKSSVVHLIGEDFVSGHARNIAYVKDEKYDIDGVYYFDPTWDSKRKEDNNEYLYRYNSFAKTKLQAEADPRYHFDDPLLNQYSIDLYDKLKNIIEDENYTELINYFKSINYMSSIINDELLLYIFHIIPNSPTYGLFDKKEVLGKLKDITDKFNKELSAETLIQVLNNVRKIEYYQDSNWYPYDVNDILNTAWISNWKLKKDYLNPAQKLLIRIFSDENKDEERENLISYIKEVDLPKKIYQVRTTKVLQKVLHKEG